MQEYEDELKKTLSEICTTQTYFGEFTNSRNIKLDDSKLPIIFIDFIKEDPIDTYELKLEYSLYIAHAAYSKNTKIREGQHKELKKLIQDINKKLFLKTLLDSQPVKIKGSKKILDAKNDNAYLTVFQKNIEFAIPENHLEGENIE